MVEYVLAHQHDIGREDQWRTELTRQIGAVATQLGHVSADLKRELAAEVQRAIRASTESDRFPGAAPAAPPSQPLEPTPLLPPPSREALEEVARRAAAEAVARASAEHRSAREQLAAADAARKQMQKERRDPTPGPGAYDPKPIAKKASKLAGSSAFNSKTDRSKTMALDGGDALLGGGATRIGLSLEPSPREKLVLNGRGTGHVDGRADDFAWNDKASAVAAGDKPVAYQGSLDLNKIRQEQGIKPLPEMPTILDAIMDDWSQSNAEAQAPN